MALINCPECNKEISDKCEVCIHCGYPVSTILQKVNTTCIINGRQFDLSFMLDKNKSEAFSKFLKLTDCRVYEAQQITDEIFRTGKIPETLTLKTMTDNVPQSEPKQYIPKCPTCQSTSISKISGLESGASIFAFGIFSKKINKTFKCNNCGYTW